MEVAGAQRAGQHPPLRRWVIGTTALRASTDNVGVMERREIEIFLVLAEELHFGRTAQRLFVSQARVSQTIAALERRFGVALFERTSRHVALTAVGQQLREDVRSGHEQVLAAIAAAVAAGRGVDGVLFIGLEAPAVADLCVDVLDLFRHRHPRIEVRVLEAEFLDPLASLRAAEIDVLVTNSPVDEPELVTGPVILREPAVLAVAAGHPLAERCEVSLDDLGGEVVLRAGRRGPPYWQDPPAPWTSPSGDLVQRGTPSPPSRTSSPPWPAVTASARWPHTLSPTSRAPRSSSYPSTPPPHPSSGASPGAPAAPPRRSEPSPRPLRKPAGRERPRRPTGDPSRWRILYGTGPDVGGGWQPGALTAPSRTEKQSIESEAEPTAVVALLADPRRIPEWAPAFADIVEGNGQSGWRASKDDRQFSLRVAANPDAGTWTTCARSLHTVKVAPTSVPSHGLAVGA